MQSNKESTDRWCLSGKKNRSKILAELTLNETKKNTGGARSMRQRRRIAGNRSQHTDKYPLASNLLLAEFKLRKAAGSKVSKLWFKKRMKSKIEACYGAEEAAKFKGSSNWFQRFKKRHNIVLRRRTNKKKSVQMMAGIRSKNSTGI